MVYHLPECLHHERNPFRWNKRLFDRFYDMQLSSESTHVRKEHGYATIALDDQKIVEINQMLTGLLHNVLPI